MKILSMSGFVPEQICDTIRFTQYTGDRNISNYCGYASDFISQVLQDSTIDGAVYPKSCDSARVITSYISGISKFSHQIIVPSYGVAGAEEFFAKEIMSYKNALEKHFEISISDIKERIEIINARNLAIRKTYECIESVSYTDYLTAIHNMFRQPLLSQNWNSQTLKPSLSGKKVFLVGSFLSNDNIAKIIENSGLVVAGDSLPESGRLVSKQPTNIKDDIYLEIAKSILASNPSPTQNYFSKIIERDFETIKHKDIKGIIFITQKYCEPYDYLYYVYKQAADAYGLPIIKISVNNTQDNGKALIALEAFANVI